MNWSIDCLCVLFRGFADLLERRFRIETLVERLWHLGCVVWLVHWWSLSLGNRRVSSVIVVIRRLLWRKMGA